MTSASPPLSVAARARGVRLPHWPVPLRIAALLAITAAVFQPGLRYTYEALRLGIDPTGPLAFVPFVPLAVIAVTVTRWAGDPAEPRLHPQRSADWTIAGMLLALAGALALQGPYIFRTETLTWRADLLPLAPFVGALVCVLFGARMLYRLRPAIGLLTAMSPALYRAVLEPLRQLIDAATAAALPLFDRGLHLASVSGAAGSRYLTIDGPGGPFTVLVAQACAGGGAVLAGGLLAATVALVSVGRRRAKFAWAATTLALCWAGNLLRLGLLVLVGHLRGEAAALGPLHAFGGAITLAISLTAALLLVGRFGLTMRKPTAHPEPHEGLPRLTSRALAGLALVSIAVAIPSGIATSSYDFLSGDSASPAPSAEARVSTVTGVTALQPVTWAPAYFGGDAQWHRWLVFAAANQRPVSVDVVTTDQLSTFDQYGLAACYGFHGYRIEVQGTTTLPGNRLGEQILYDDPASGDRVRVLSWRQRGFGDRYERVVIQHRSKPGDGDDQILVDNAALTLLAPDDKDARVGGINA